VLRRSTPLPVRPQGQFIDPRQQVLRFAQGESFGRSRWGESVEDLSKSSAAMLEGAAEAEHGIGDGAGTGAAEAHNADASAAGWGGDGDDGVGVGEGHGFKGSGTGWSGLTRRGFP